MRTSTDPPPAELDHRLAAAPFPLPDVDGAEMPGAHRYCREEATP